MAEPAGPARRTLGAGATLATASQLVGALAGGVMGIVLARLLGPGGTGEFNVILTAVVVLSAVCSLGVEIGLNYHVSGRRWSPAAALRQSQLAALVLGGAGIGIGLGLGYLLRDSAFEGVSMGALALGLATLPFTFSWTYSAYAALSHDHYEAFAAPPAVQNLIGLVAATALAIPFGVAGAAAGISISHAVVAVAMLAWGVRAFGPAPAGWLREALGRLRQAVSFGLRANLGNILQLLNYRADLFVLNAVVSRAEVGRYAIAISITMLGQLLPRALASVVLPRVATLDSGAEERELNMVMVKSVRHGVILAVATSALLGLGLLLVPFVYGEDFRGTMLLGWLLLPGVAFAAVGGILSASIVGKGKPQYSLYNVLIVTPPTLAMYALLIPEFGAQGAAIASSISYIATTLLAWLYFKRVTGLGREALIPGTDELLDYRLLGGRLRARLRSGTSASASE